MAILNITNFDDHPNEPMWMVFRFGKEQMAKEFIAGLNAAGIRHEADESVHAPFLVGVRQKDRETAVRINYTVLGRYRSPFIADRTLRWGVIGLVAILSILVIIGMLLEK
jgi:hypothetical protein